MAKANSSAEANVTVGEDDATSAAAKSGSYAKASVGDFESWLKDADAVKERVCSVAVPEKSRREQREVKRQKEELRRKLFEAPGSP